MLNHSGGKRYPLWLILFIRVATRLPTPPRAQRDVTKPLHALTYNLDNFLRTLATPEPIKDWSLTSLKEKLIKIGAKVVSHGQTLASLQGHGAGTTKSREAGIIDRFSPTASESRRDRRALRIERTCSFGAGGKALK